MTISVLVCKADGTQVLEEREVSEQYLQTESPSENLDGTEIIPSQE